MKKLLLSFPALFLLAGCSVTITHDINEDGNLHFTEVFEIPFIEGNEQKKAPTQEQVCDETLAKWDQVILEPTCTVKDDEGGTQEVPSRISTFSGKYQISNKHFIKKDGHILFNAQAIVDLTQKKGEQIAGPDDNASEQARKAGVISIYRLNLPGEPVNYQAGTEFDFFQITNDINTYFVSKIGPGTNPFTDKLTEENAQNIERLKHSPEIANQEDLLDAVVEGLIENAQETGTPLLTNIEQENKAKEQAISSVIYQGPQTLPSTGEPSIGRKIMNSVRSFFQWLF